MLTFPSPCGDYGSYRRLAHWRWTVWKLVSVPLRGLWFLSPGSRERRMRRSRFRPLAGIMVLIPRVRRSILRRMERVSVPLRGLWFLSPRRKIMATYFDISVSVPLRGLWFLSPETLEWGISLRPLQFPSPCGDYGSYPEYQNPNIIKIGNFEFPSPCGDYGSYHLVRQGKILKYHEKVSVPLRGLWFLSGKNIP